MQQLSCPIVPGRSHVDLSLLDVGYLQHAYEITRHPSIKLPQKFLSGNFALLIRSHIHAKVWRIKEVLPGISESTTTAASLESRPCIHVAHAVGWIHLVGQR